MPYTPGYFQNISYECQDDEVEKTGKNAKDIFKMPFGTLSGLIEDKIVTKLTECMAIFNQGKCRFTPGKLIWVK